jgi:ribosomal protein L37AE/L43A
LKRYFKKFIVGVWPEVSIKDSQKIIKLVDKIHSHAWEPFGRRQEEFKTSVKVVKFKVWKCTVCNNAVTQEMQESNLLMFASLQTSIGNKNMHDFAT